MPLAIVCEHCGTKLRAPDHAVGKRVQCPCGAKLIVPTPREEQSSEAAVSLDQLADGASVGGGAVCPQCHTEVPPGAVLCTSCGFSLSLGMQLATDADDEAAGPSSYTRSRGLSDVKRGHTSGTPQKSRFRRDPDAAPFNWGKLVIVAVLGLGGFAGYRWIQTMRNFDPEKYAQEKLASIKPGMSLAQVVTNLGEPQEVYRNGTEKGTDTGLGYGPLKAAWSMDFLKDYNGRLSEGFFLVYRFSAGGGYHISFDSAGTMMSVEDAPNLFKG